jgi:protein regulator of cytokinesis 1
MFKNKFETMKSDIQGMRKRLMKLWKFLEVPEEKQRKVEKHVEVNQTTHATLQFELERCEQIKRENIGVFIDRVRAEIKEYWEKCKISDSERSRFPFFSANNYIEDVLTRTRIFL